LSLAKRDERNRRDQRGDPFPVPTIEGEGNITWGEERYGRILFDRQVYGRQSVLLGV